MSELIHPARGCDTGIVCVIFVQQVVFLTVNHRGPLPLRELHSTDETLVWRDPRGSWACLQPVSNYKWINSPCQRVWHRPVWLFFFFFFFSFLFSSLFIFLQQVVFLTVNHRGPLPLRELHSTDETIVWRDPGGSWACLRPVAEYEWIHPAWNSNTDIMVWHLWAAVHSTGKTWYGCGETDGDRGWNILPGY